MFEELRQNIEHEKKIIREIKSIELNIPKVDDNEKDFYLTALNSLKNQLGILNKSVVSLLGDVSGVSDSKQLSSYSVSPETIKKKPKTENKENEVVNVSYISPSTKQKKFVTIGKKDKEDFIKQLSLSESYLSKLKEKNIKEEQSNIKKPKKIIRYSNILFSSFGEKLAPQFKEVQQDLKKANMQIVISSYIALALFVSLSLFFLGALSLGVAGILGVSVLKWMWIPFVLLFISFLGFYFYPASEKGSVEKRITDELPFAVIYMAAIAGSNIEPTKIFKIISSSSEYPNVGLEIKKLLYQIDIYGYDLVNALKNAASRTSNKELSELFSGLGTNIVSGGSLKNYLEKRADNLLTDYKLRRQKYTSVAETFMDIYISVLIAAPLILMLLVIVMNTTGLSLGLSVNAVLFLTVGIVVLLNIIFLIVIHFKQPRI